MFVSFRFSQLPFPYTVKCDKAFFDLVSDLWSIIIIPDADEPSMVITYLKNEINIHIPADDISYKVVKDDKRRLFLLIRFFLELHALTSNIIFFHASSVTIDEKGFLFLGQSGNGKSTISHLLAPADILGDDIGVIRIFDKKLQLLANPFEKITLAQPMILSHIFRLKQSIQNKVVELDLKEKISLLLDNSLLFLYLQNKSKTPFLPESLRKKKSKELFPLMYTIIENCSIMQIDFNLDLDKITFLKLLNL